MMKSLYAFLFLMISFFCDAQTKNSKTIVAIPGANKVMSYYPMLENKNIAVVANQTSTINNTHLVDTLLSLNVRIKYVFAPEHGFRGDVEAGGKIESSIDSKTGLKIISLYGNHLKPTADDLKQIDIVLFDIQDVGARFYTYISTLQYVMEACAENNKKLIVLDRPNPNGFYVDGPVLETKFKSFVGMQPVPVVYGMTIGEYANMINSEGWLDKGVKCNLKVITCDHYDHTTFYDLPIAPSPNLPNMNAVYLYPSLCFFEGTPISVGRGTDFPFQVIGFPEAPNSVFSFTPVSKPAALHPPYENQKCNAVDLRPYAPLIKAEKRIQLKWLIQFYWNYPARDKFFTDFFNKLAGTDKLQTIMKIGTDENAIRDSWKNDIAAFKIIRKKYLLYKDFE